MTDGQNNPLDPGGMGEILSKAGKGTTVADANLIRRAVRERWPMSEERRQKLITILCQIAETDTFEVEKIESKPGPNGEGSGLASTVATVRAPNHRNQIAAARTLTIMVGQNQKDEHHADDVARGRGVGPTFVQVNFNQCPPKRPPNLLLPSSSNGPTRTPHSNGSSSATNGTGSHGAGGGGASPPQA